MSVLSNHHKNAGYNYKRGWSTAVQPFRQLSREEYIDIAAAAASDALEQSRTFMRRNDFSFIEISHADFRDFETSSKNFRQWLEDYCAERNKEIKEAATANGTKPVLMDPRADFMIMGPRIKSDDSAYSKTIKKGSADGVFDYLAIQHVALKQTTCKKNRHSLESLSQAIAAVEFDTNSTIAIKNHFWEPKAETGFRGHYNLRLATVPHGHDLEGFQVLYETKMEHESQMDLDKLTRKFMNIDRSAQKAQLGVFKTLYSTMADVFNSFTSHDAKQAARLSKKEAKKIDVMKELRLAAHDFVYAQAGLNTFLNPQKIDAHVSKSARDMMEYVVRVIQDNFTNGNAKALIETVKGSPFFADAFSSEVPASKKEKRALAA